MAVTLLGLECDKTLRTVMNDPELTSLRRVPWVGRSFRRPAEVGVRLERKGAAYAVLASAAVLVACPSSPPKSPDQERADSATAERVLASLEANPIYYFRDVEVTVDYGVAQLSGYVWTTDALYAAQGIARKVPGV